MNKYIVFFNGPPSSGKDLYARGLVEYMNGVVKGSAGHYEVKTQLIDLTCLLYSVSREFWDSHYTTEGKEIARDRLGGLSQRQALIDVSENLIKPHFGDLYFGDCAVKRVKADGKELASFSDGGFISEIEAFGDEFGFESILLVRLHRDGYTFAGDSRSYINDDRIKSVDVKTGGDISDTQVEINTHVLEWMQELNY